MRLEDIYTVLYILLQESVFFCKCMKLVFSGEQFLNCYKTHKYFGLYRSKRVWHNKFFEKIRELKWNFGIGALYKFSHFEQCLIIFCSSKSLHPTDFTVISGAHRWTAAGQLKKRNEHNTLLVLRNDFKTFFIIELHTLWKCTQNPCPMSPGVVT